MTLRARLFTAIVAAVLVSTVLTVGVAELLLHHRAEAQALRTLSSDATVAAASPLRTASAATRPRAARRALRRAGGGESVFSVRASGAKQADLDALCGQFGASVIDRSPESVTALCAADPAILDAFEQKLRSYGITELQRTGAVALPKLAATGEAGSD